MQDIQTHLLKSHWLGKLSKLKSGEIWETVQKSKKSQVSVGNHSKFEGEGGGLRKSKKSQVPEGTKD